MKVEEEKDDKRKRNPKNPLGESLNISGKMDFLQIRKIKNKGDKDE